MEEWLFLTFIFYFNFCLYVWVVGMYICECGCPQRPGDGVRPPPVIDGCETPSMNSAKTSTLLTAESSHQIPGWALFLPLQQTSLMVEVQFTVLSQIYKTGVEL